MPDEELVESGERPLAVTDQEIIDEWIRWLADSEGASPATVDAYRRSVERFSKWLGVVSPSALVVTPVTIMDWKTALSERYSPATVNLRLSAVRSLYRFLVVTGRLRISPASEVKGANQRKTRRHKRDPLSNGEVIEVLQTCQATPVGIRDRAILTLMAYCAVRTIEIHRANTSDLRTTDNRLVLEAHGKGGADRLVVVPRDQEGTIRAWVSQRGRLVRGDGPLFVTLSRRSKGVRLSPRAIRAMIKDRFKLAGVVDERRKTAHSLRHAAITNAIRHGATPLQVQAMAGHTSFDTTLVYYHEAARTTEPAEDTISYENGV